MGRVIVINPKPEAIRNELVTLSSAITEACQALVGLLDDSWDEDEQKLTRVLDESAAKLVHCLETLPLPDKDTDMLVWQHDMRSPIASLMGASGVFLDMEEFSSHPRKAVITRIWELAEQAEQQLQTLVNEQGL